MARLLSDVMPLRTTQDVGDFVAPVVLPVPYGDTLPYPIPAISQRDYVVADCAVHSVTAIYVDKQPVQGYAIETRELAGRVATVCVFDAAPAVDAIVWAAVKGKRNGATGDLIENPADVVLDVLTLAGAVEAIDPEALSDFRAEASRARVKAAGVLLDRESVRATIAGVLKGVGAAWSARRMTLYPSAPAPSLVTLTARKDGLPSLFAESDDFALAVRVNFAWHWGLGRPESAIDVEASGGEAIERAPERKTVEMKWIRDTATAQSAAIALCQRFAGDVLKGEMSAAIPHADEGGVDALTPGRWVRIESPYASGDALITGRVFVPWERAANVTFELMPATLPSVRVVALRNAQAIPKQGGVEVESVGNTRTLTITDNDGKPIPHAWVSVDGAEPKLSNAQGRVTLTATAGPHTIAIEADGKQPLTLDVTFF